MVKRLERTSEIREKVTEIDGYRYVRRQYLAVAFGDYRLQIWSFVHRRDDQVIFRTIESFPNHNFWDFEIPGSIIGRASWESTSRHMPEEGPDEVFIDSRTIEDPDEILRHAEEDQLMSFSANGWAIPIEPRVWIEPSEEEVIWAKPGFKLLRAQQIPKAQKVRMHFKLHTGFEAVVYIKDLESGDSVLAYLFELDRIDITYQGHVIQHLGPTFWSLDKWLNWCGKKGRQVFAEANRMIERDWIRRTVKEKSGKRDDNAPGL